MLFTGLCTYQKLSVDHLSEIMSIERRASLHPWAASVMKDALMRAHTEVWGIRVDEEKKLVGFSVMSFVANEADLLLIAVDPIFQGQGLGGDFLSFLLKSAKIRQIKQVYLEVANSNQVALALYAKKGFKQQVVRRQYYPAMHGQRADAIVMVCSL